MKAVVLFLTVRNVLDQTAIEQIQIMSYNTNTLIILYFLKEI